MHDLLADVRPAVLRLLPRGAPLVVATSGGPDSQVLLDVLARLRPELDLGEIIAVGVDHGLRPEAGRELDLAETLSRAHGARFLRCRVTVPADGNLLATARRVRYQKLREVAHQVGAKRIVVGHSATDQAETVLMRLTRGSDLRGAAGIPERRGVIVRPLLGINREMIAAYAEARDIPYARDPSNHDRRRARSVLRHDILPALARLNPEVVQHLASFASVARRDEVHLSDAAQQILEAARGPQGSLWLQPLRDAPVALATRALRAWLAELDLAAPMSLLNDLWKSPPSGRIRLRGGAVLADRDRLWPPGPASELQVLGVPGELALPELGVRLRAQNCDDFAPSSAMRVAFDADKLHLPLQVRPFGPGDRFQPFGSEGHVKVGNLFTNMKLPRPLRQRWPLVVSGGEIAWVVGLRRASLAPVTQASKQLVCLEVVGALPFPAC